MRQLNISGQAGNSIILVGERLENIRTHLPPEARVIIITDETVESLYAEQMPAAERIVIGTGEAAKTLDTASAVYHRLIRIEADRGVFLLGVGGGIVCDITGFVAGTYLRGVRFANIATTLLAQVDASVGGKTGVNFDGYKNMIGMFNQPSFVVCDPMVLQTLSDREIANGFAEIVKHAVIYDAEYFTLIEKYADQALALEPELMERIIYDSVAIKSDVVNRDELEHGERRKLNFGHTIGHAVEKTAGLLHGEAVSIGMAAAAMISVRKGLMAESDAERIKALLVSLGLPIEARFDPESVFDALARDKKRMDDSIHFVLLAGVGQSIMEPVELGELKQFLENLAGR
ncbi:MAG: 3-dehydroquinate synthase [Desulfobacteraceae bacterium]|nr:3-dehydroquinate synthase [Desulfobacteraceae bacterium]MCF8094152.1 3-dehydroquinate synthase [Desulfobacteraceae bacterium]